MFTVYLEKEKFEEIVLYKDKSPNWYSILSNYAYICLNMSEADLQNEQQQGTILFEFIQANGGKSLVALNDYFDLIYQDPSEILNKPRSAFFLKLNDAQAKQLSESFGMIVQGTGTIDDSALTGTYFKELAKDTTIENGTNIGWQHLLSVQMPPSNALIICDSYLFNDSALGEANTIRLLGKLLPPALAVEYHVTLVAEDNGRDQTWRAQLTGRLVTAIRNLRPYTINIEIVFAKSEHFHKRRLILNYINASCDKGFCVFKDTDHKTVKWNNDLRFNRLFNFKDSIGGDTDYDSATSGLRVVKKVTFDLAQHISGGNTVYLGSIMGGHNANNTPKNRLINDV